MLKSAGLGTLLFDLLTKEEEAIDLRTAQLRFDIALLSLRLLAATDWLLEKNEMRGVLLGYFGSSTGGAAALVAAVKRPEAVRAIMLAGQPNRHGRRSAGESYGPNAVRRGRSRYPSARLEPRIFRRTARRETQVISGATHLFEERGKLERGCPDGDNLVCGAREALSVGTTIIQEHPQHERPFWGPC